MNNNNKISASHSYKLNKLISVYDIMIQAQSFQNLNSVPSAKDMLLNPLKFGPVESIFVVLMVMYHIITSYFKVFLCYNCNICVFRCIYKT